MRVNLKDRGFASEFKCVRCDNPAVVWVNTEPTVLRNPYTYQAMCLADSIAYPEEARARGYYGEWHQ